MQRSQLLLRGRFDDNMLRERIDEYTGIDQSCAEFTLTEEKLGAYETVEVGFGLTGAA